MSKKTTTKATPEHLECRAYWCEKYKERTNTVYIWDGAAGKALNAIIEKLKTDTSGADPIDLFKLLVNNLPQWYIDNSYLLTTVNKCFNAITANINKNGNGKQQQQQTGVSADYLASLMRRANNGK